MPNVLPTIPQEPAQGIQALLDTVYLWNPDVANNLIEQVNQLLEELGELSNLSGTIKPYSQLEAPVRQYMPMSYNDGVYVANEEMTTLPATPDLTKWTLIATKVDEQALEQQISSAVGGEADLRRQADTALQGNINAEERARIAADQGLQTQIDAISAASDVKDIVGTYQELENYDTSTLGDNDIIKVLQDETQEDATTYYRWVAAEDEFQLIGEEGPYYTRAQTDAMLEAKQDIMQFETMPEADASNANKVIQYVGEDIPESRASAVATQTVGSGLTSLSVNVDTFVEAEQPSGSETVNFVAVVGNKEIVGDTTGYLGPNGDVELTITNPSAFVEKAKNAWDTQYGEQYGYFEDVVDRFLISAMGDTNLGVNVVREVDCVVGGSSYSVAPVFPDASEWYLQVAPTPMLDGEWGFGFNLGNNVTWSKNGTTVDLASYGISYSGTPVDGDVISVAYTPAVKPVTSGYFYVSAPVLEPAQATAAQTAGAHGTTIETSIAYTWQGEPTNPPVNYVIDAQALYDAMDSYGWTGYIETHGFTPETSINSYFQYEPDADGGLVGTPNGGWLYGYTDSIISFPDGAPNETFRFYTRNFQYAHELTNLSVDVDAFVAAEQPIGDTTVDFVATVYNDFQLSPTSFEVEGGTLTVDPDTFLQAYRNYYGDPDNVYLFEVEVQSGNFYMVVYYTGGNFDAWIDPAEFGFSYTGDLSELTTTTICNINCTEPGAYWYKNGSLVDIAQYGISYDEEPEDGDTITVTYTAPFISSYAWEQINVQPGGAGGIKWAGQWDKPASTTWNYYCPHYIFPTLPDGNYELFVQSKSLYQYSSGIQVWSHKTFKITFGVTNHRSRGIVAWVLDGSTDFYSYNMSSIATFTHWSSYYESNPLDRIVADYVGACRIGNATIRASAVEGIFRWTNIKNTDTGEEIPVEIDVLLNPTGSGNQIGSYNAGNPVDPPHIPQALSYTTGDCSDSAQYIMFGDTLLPQVHTVALCGSFKIVLKDADGSEWRCVVENNANSYVARVLKASGIFVNTQLGWAEGANIGGTCVFLNTPAGTEKTIEMWISLYGTTVSADCWLTQSVSNFTPVLVTRPGSLVTTDNFGLIEQYTGETDANYTNGYFYKATGTKVNVPESIATTTITPVGEATVTIDLANWIDAVSATYGWGAETIRLWLADYAGVTWNLSYDADNAEVTKLYIPWYGDTYEQNILQYVTVAYTGSQEGEVWVQFQEQYTKAHEEIQNGHWEQIDVQPAPSGLPDQTGQSGKFLTTDGTDASWSDKAVVNNATGNYSIAIGDDSVCEANNSVAIGELTRAVGSYNVAIGSRAGNSSSSGQAGQKQIAIGYFAKTRAYGAIQLGSGQNRDANTFKVGNDNGNYEMMSADGTIPADRLVHAINWYSTMPTASADNLDDIIQFTGATDANYTNGYFYKCVVASTTPVSATIAQTTGNTLSDLTVDGETFWEKLGDYSIPQQTGDYAFTYDEGVEGWKFDNNYFDLEAEFGVTYTGTPADGDVLTISVTAPSATYAWTQIDVQPAPEALPDQTGQSGKFLTTDGTDASWSDKPLVNRATGTQSVSILGSTNSQAISSQYAVTVGDGGWVSNLYGVGVGKDAYVAGRNGVAIGASATAVKDWSTALGSYARTNAIGAIQIGSLHNSSSTTNSDANTFKVANANGNFEIMSADGTIPEARLADTTSAQQGDVLTLDSTGNAVWQAGGGGSYTAGTGIDITNDVISVTAPTLRNLASYDSDLSIYTGTSMTNDNVCIGRANRTSWSGFGGNIEILGTTTNNSGIAIGLGSVAKNMSIAIGASAVTTDHNTIQIGKGTNAEDGTMCVGLYNGSAYVNHKLLDNDGTIPEARLADTTNAQQGDVLTLDANGDAVWQAGGGGSSYTAGVGIDITNDEISLDGTASGDLPSQDTDYVLIANEDSGTGEVSTAWTDRFVNSVNGNTGDVQLFPEDILSVPQYPYLANDEAFDPQAPRNQGLVVQYSGATDQDYTQGYFYKSVIDTSVPESATLGTVQEVGISNVALAASTFITAMGGNDYDQSYTFNWNDTDGEWFLEEYQENVGSGLASYGITYDGTPTEGDSITVEYTAQGYKWEQIDVQPSSGGLPTQTGNAGKFLTTDGTDASWSDKPLVNATTTGGLSILGSVSTYNNAISIGPASYSQIGSISIGHNTCCYGNDSVMVGYYATNSSGKGTVGVGEYAYTDGNYSMALGYRAYATAAGAIQLGCATTTAGNSNNDANTFKVANANGNFEIMSADGTVPTARLTKVNTTATLAVADWSSSTQTVTVSGVKADSVVFVSPAPASASDYASAGILCTAQAANSLTFICTTTPTSAITVNVVCM